MHDLNGWSDLFDEGMMGHLKVKGFQTDYGLTCGSPKVFEGIETP